MGAGHWKNLGFGLGLRPEHYEDLPASKTRVDWLEAVTENYFPLTGGGPGRPLENLLSLRRDYPVVLHGVSMSIGSVDPLNQVYLQNLKTLIQQIQPEWVSDHLSWSSFGGRYLYDLMPLPYTEETLRHVVPRIQQVQEFLGARILMENVSSYLAYAESEMTEWEFLREIAVRSDCGLLLDVNNIYVSSVNHAFDPMDYVRAIPAERIGQIHLAGHSNNGHYLVDTHDQPVPEPVWNLYRQTIALMGPATTMIERDDNIPPLSELILELDRARRESTLGEASRRTVEVRP